MRPPRSFTAWLLLLALLAPLAAGCLYTRALSDTPRTATEQLLLTSSMERAVADLELPVLSGRSVALELVSLAESDAAYLEALLGERLRKEGAQLAEVGAADVVLVFFVGGLGTVSRGVEFGIPPLPLGAYVTPGLPIFRILKQRGYTQLRLVARDGQEQILAERGPVLGRASFDLYSFLLLAIRRNDIFPGEAFEFSVD